MTCKFEQQAVHAAYRVIDTLPRQPATVLDWHWLACLPGPWQPFDELWHLSMGQCASPGNSIFFRTKGLSVADVCFFLVASCNVPGLLSWSDSRPENTLVYFESLHERAWMLTIASEDASVSHSTFATKLCFASLLRLWCLRANMTDLWRHC